MVDVVGHHFLGQPQHNIKHRTVGITRIEEGLDLRLGHIAALAQHLECESAQRLQLGRGQGGFIAQGSADVIAYLHALCDPGMGGDAIVAFMFHVDGLPDDGHLIGIKCGLGEQPVHHLIPFKQLRAFCHDLVQTGQAAECLLAVFQQRLGCFGRGFEVMGREIGHG